jgi:hypothetical protein
MDFPKEAELVFYKEVEPAVLEIEEAVRSNSYLKKFARNIVDKPFVLPGTSLFGVLLGQMSALPEIISLALSGAAGSALIGHNTYEQWKERTKQIEQNQLFFYYKAGKLLERSP